MPYSKCSDGCKTLPGVSSALKNILSLLQWSASSCMHTPSMVCIFPIHQPFSSMHFLYPSTPLTVCFFPIFPPFSSLHLLYPPSPLTVCIFPILYYTIQYNRYTGSPLRAFQNLFTNIYS